MNPKIPAGATRNHRESGAFTGGIDGGLADGVNACSVATPRGVHDATSQWPLCFFSSIVKVLLSQGWPFAPIRSRSNATSLL